MDPGFKLVVKNLFDEVTYFRPATLLKKRQWWLPENFPKVSRTFFVYHCRKMCGDFVETCSFRRASDHLLEISVANNGMGFYPWSLMYNPKIVLVLRSSSIINSISLLHAPKRFVVSKNNT